jgi:hypothetical protein
MIGLWQAKPWRYRELRGMFFAVLFGRLLLAGLTIYAVMWAGKLLL